MLAAIRGFAKSPVAILLMGLLIVSFAIWGVQDAFKAKVALWVIKAGSHEVSASDFKDAFERAVRSEEQKVGRPIPRDEAIAAGADRQILSGLADQNAVAELVKRLGVRPDDKLVLAELAQNPAFTDPLTGRFSYKAYRRVLADNRVSWEAVEADTRDGIAQRHLFSGLGVGTKLPTIYSTMMAAYMLEGRNADFILLGEHAVAAPTKPTDSQLKAYMQEHESQFKMPEFRTISLVRFSAGAVAPAMTADPAEVQKRFDVEKASLNTPERRVFVQINLKDAGKATTAAARLAKGEDPAAVAKALGATSTPYPATSQRAIPDPKVAAAVFALQPGQSSAPIASEFGTVVVKLLAITPAKEASLDEARAKIEGELKSEAAETKVYDLEKKYMDARESGAQLAKAAQVAGVKVYPLGPLTAQGVIKATRQKEPALTDKMLAEAFALPVGGETEVEDLGKGEAYALRVDAITPAALPNLDEVRPLIAQRYMVADLIKRLQARGAELSARLDKGEPIDKVAASAGLQVQHVKDVSQATAAQHQNLGQAFLTKLFAAKPGDTFTADTGAGVVVGKVSAITSGKLDEVARAASQGQSQVANMMMNDMGETLRYIARERIKPKVNPARARIALGMSPEEAAATTKPAKAK